MDINILWYLLSLQIGECELYDQIVSIGMDMVMRMKRSREILKQLRRDMMKRKILRNKESRINMHAMTNMKRHAHRRKVVCKYNYQNNKIFKNDKAYRNNKRKFKYNRC